MGFPHGESALSRQVIPYTIPPEPHQWRSAVLALLVHLALLAFLWIGVSWQSLTPTTIEAEIWDPTSRDAAPPPPEPEPVPEPPKPVPETSPPLPKVAPEPPKVRQSDPDIALEQEKKRKREKEKLSEEKQQREEQEKKRLAEEQQRQKEEQALKDKAKLEEEQKRKQEAAAAEENKRRQEAAAAEEKKRKQEQAAAKPRKLISADEMDQITRQAGDGEAGEAEKKSGAAGTACERYIGTTVKSNTSFPDVVGNPKVIVRIRLNANRMPEEVKIAEPSGNAAFDKQVERGIRKSGPFPPECPSSITYMHSLNSN